MRALFLALLIGLAACTGQFSGTARGLFTGYVTDKTEDEVIEKVGKPDVVDNKLPTAPKWVYKKKTFDPDNPSKIDDETILIFQKGADGKFKVSQVIFG